MLVDNFTPTFTPLRRCEAVLTISCTEIPFCQGLTLHKQTERKIEGSMVLIEAVIHECEISSNRSEEMRRSRDRCDTDALQQIQMGTKMTKTRSLSGIHT